MNQELVQYLQQQIRTLDERLKVFTHDKKSKPYPNRFMFVKMKRYMDGFLDKTSPNKMVIIPGFRGVGKTTLMSQLCSKYKEKVKHSLFISVEEIKAFFDVGIHDVMMAYEEILGEHLESIKEPIIIFLDEIQSDPKWAISLKSLFERTSNVFFCCSGSSAVVLQSTSDLVRRAIFEKMPPMSFSEYQMAKNDIFPIKQLKSNIKQAVYFSKDAKEVYDSLIALKPQVNQYWSKADRLDIRKYLSHGTLPFSFIMPNETAIYLSISALIDKVIQHDLPMLAKFNNETLGTVKRILFAIAENDTTSLKNLEETVKIQRETLSNIFDALEKAELLIKIHAYGSNMTAAKKPNKYLFMSPAIRMSFFYFTGQESTYLNRQGKLLEDSVGSHLYREFILRGHGAIRYDSAAGGADFILQIANSKQIIIEVGMGKKDNKQIINTAKKVKSDYNLVFSDSELIINEKTKTVFVPLEYYLLM